MADLSNKALSLLLLVAMVVSVSGTLVTLSRLNNAPTGMAISQDAKGVANFTVNSSLSIIFAVNNTNFGTGYINTTTGNCNVSTTAAPTSGCLGGGWLTGSNLTIENNGNVNANISLLIAKNASTFVGDGGNFSIEVLQNETGSCQFLNATFNTTFYSVDGNLTGGTYGTRICTNLTAVPDGTDSVKVLVFLSIPANATITSHSTQITATGCDDATC